MFYYYGNRNPDKGSAFKRGKGGKLLKTTQGRDARNQWKDQRGRAARLGITGVRAYGR